jgi:hypothetical protein
MTQFLLVCDFNFAHQPELMIVPGVRFSFRMPEQCGKNLFLVMCHQSQISTVHSIQSSTRVPMMTVFTVLDFLQGTCHVNWLSHLSNKVRAGNRFERAIASVEDAIVTSLSVLPGVRF